MTKALVILAKIIAATYAATYVTTSMADDLRRPAELNWVKDSDSQAATLTRQPVECIKPLDDPRINLGRLAFNSPRLLGGQAGRMGLSCASCHPSGRTNKQFFIHQISDKPGNADISHHFLSSRGGDKIFNPQPIPDLADTKSLRFKNHNDATFDNLLIRLIEVEFDGQPANINVFESLKRYLTNIDTTHCKTASQTIARTLDSDWRLINDGMVALRFAIESQQADTITFVSASMRATLEMFYRFYSITPDDSIDKKLISISRFLEELAAQNSTRDQLDQVNSLSHQLDALKQNLNQQEQFSFYNYEQTVAYLKRSR